MSEASNELNLCSLLLLWLSTKWRPMYRSTALRNLNSPVLYWMNAVHIRTYFTPTVTSKPKTHGTFHMMPQRELTSFSFLTSLGLPAALRIEPKVVCISVHVMHFSVLRSHVHLFGWSHHCAFESTDKARRKSSDHWSPLICTSLFPNRNRLLSLTRSSASSCAQTLHTHTANSIDRIEQICLNLDRSIHLL